MRRELKILLALSSLATMAAGFFGPIYAIFVEQIGGDLLEAGGAYAAYSISTGILIFLISRWEDHVKNIEKLIVVGFFLDMCAFSGYLFVRNPFELMAIQVIAGLATAIVNPAWDSLYSKSVDGCRRASQWGIWESEVNIVAAVAAVLGGLIAELYGFRSLFLAMLGLSVIAFLTSLLLLRKRRRKAS